VDEIVAKFQARKMAAKAKAVRTRKGAFKAQGSGYKKK
jgi:hypothetical protein